MIDGKLTLPVNPCLDAGNLSRMCRPGAAVGHGLVGTSTRRPPCWGGPQRMPRTFTSVIDRLVAAFAGDEVQDQRC
jgi:hypothetical protein